MKVWHTPCSNGRWCACDLWKGVFFSWQKNLKVGGGGFKKKFKNLRSECFKVGSQRMVFCVMKVPHSTNKRREKQNKIRSDFYYFLSMEESNNRYNKKVCTSVGWLSKISKKTPSVIKMVLRVRNRDPQKPKNWFSEYTNMPLSNILQNQITIVYNCQFSSLKPPVLLLLLQGFWNNQNQWSWNLTCIMFTK